jgi:hypothetical protein
MDDIADACEPLKSRGQKATLGCELHFPQPQASLKPDFEQWPLRFEWLLAILSKAVSETSAAAFLEVPSFCTIQRSIVNTLWAVKIGTRSQLANFSLANPREIGIY